MNKAVIGVITLFVLGIMAASSASAENTQDKQCRDIHVLVERSNGSLACMTEKTAERAADRFGWKIITVNPADKTVSDPENPKLQDDGRDEVDGTESSSDQAANSEQNARPKTQSNSGTFCNNGVCKEIPYGETIEFEQTGHVQKTVDGKLVIEEEKIPTTVTIGTYPEKILKDCTPTDGIMQWGDLYNGSKILEPLQREIDSGKTRLCVSIFFSAGTIDQVHGFLADELGVDVEGSRNDRGRHIIYDSDNALYAVIPVSLIGDVADRDDVVNIDVYGKNTSTPYHIERGHSSKISPLLQKEVEHKQKNCTYEEDFPDTCPPLRQNSDGEYLVHVAIRTEHITRQDVKLDFINTNGMSAYYNQNSRKAANDAINAETAKQNKVLAQPVFDFLKENNMIKSWYVPKEDHSATDRSSGTNGRMLYYSNINLIYIIIPIDLLPHLVELDSVWFVDTTNYVSRVNDFQWRQ